MKLEKLDTRLEMQAIFLPDGTEVGSNLEVLPECISDCLDYECSAEASPGLDVSCSF
jgi:hypothetical protein